MIDIFYNRLSQPQWSVIGAEPLEPFCADGDGRISSFNGVILFDYNELATPISDYCNGKYWYVRLSNGSGATYSYKFRILDSEGNVVSDYENEASSAAHRYKQLNLIKGDLDYDGQITENDSDIVINHILGTQNLSNLQLYLGDINEDGYVTISDLRYIQQMLSSTASRNKIESFIQAYENGQSEIQ